MELNFVFSLFVLNKACVKSHSNVATSFQTEKTEGKKGLTKTGRRTSRILLLTVYYLNKHDF